MRLAQQLYEGIDIGEGQVGLITYMRTDSLNLAVRKPSGRSAKSSSSCTARQGLSEEPRVVQDQVEECAGSARGDPPTVQPTCVPASIENKLDADQFKLYSLIWKRTVACQMAHAVFDTVTVEMRAGDRQPRRRMRSASVLRANGSTLGDARLHFRVSGRHGRCRAQDDSDHVLPPIKEGDKVKLLEGIAALRSISPSRRRASRRPRWSRRSRNTASAARRPTPRSSRRLRDRGNTWRSKAGASPRPTSARSSAAF